MEVCSQSQSAEIERETLARRAFDDNHSRSLRAMKKKKSVRRTTEKHHPNHRWFRSVLEQKGLNQSEVAKASEILATALSKALAGKRRFTIKEAAALSRVLDLPYTDVLHGLGIALDAPESPRSCEVSGWIDGSAQLRLRRPGDGQGLRGHKTAPCPFGDRDIRVARVQSIGTEHDGLDGALVYFRESKARGVDPNAIGRLALVELQGGDCVLRVVRRGYAAGRYNLTTLSGRIIEESVSVEAVHPVVWLKV